MIEIVKDSGFCQGVSAAVNTANSYESGVYLYGNLVNNSHVMEQYRNKGFVITEDVANIPPGSTLIIRAHGAPKSLFETLPHVNIVDCTCVKVKRIHKIVEKVDKTIIIGKKNHPEVIGTLGWCRNGMVYESEADNLNISPTDDVCVVGQTTCNPDWWSRAVELIKQRCPNAKIYDTLCNVTVLKRKRAQDLAAKVDVMVVVGDKESANSVELYNACTKACKNTFFISSKEDLMDKDCINKDTKIGLVGSASAPAEVIEETHEYLAFVKFLAEAKAEIEECSNFNISSDFLVLRMPKLVDSALRDFYDQHSGGKYIRGAIIKLGEQLVSEKPKNYLDVAAAYEVFQTAILIHDDIMDRSETRRGKKTIHAMDYEATKDWHYAYSRALCIGNMGLFHANSILASANIDNAIKVNVLIEFAATQIVTIEGEVMDVLLPYNPINPAVDFTSYCETVGEIYKFKTSIYTVEGPLVMGILCGGKDERFAYQFRSMSRALGIAFQIKDDLLGMFADEKTLGKPALSDLREKKQTLLYGYAYKNATQLQRETLDSLYGKQDATLQDLEIVRDIFTQTGAKKHAEDEISKTSQNCLNEIANLPITDEGKILLRGLVHYLTVRRY